MLVFRSKRFGEVPVAPDGAYVTRKVAVGSQSIPRSLFIGMELDQAMLDRAAALVDTLDILDAQARETIDANTSEVPTYVHFHLEELDDGVVQELFGAPKGSVDRPTFLARLDLVGVSVHARSPEGFSLVLDYSPGRAHTDQLLAVRFDTSGRAVAVSHES